MLRFDKDRINRALFELMCGILTVGVILEIALVILWALKGNAATYEWITVNPRVYMRNELYNFTHNFNLVYFSLGLWLGILLALFYAYHLWRSIDRALDYPEDTASKKLRISFLVRYAVILAAMLLIQATGRASWLTLFVGLCSVKLGAYLNKPMKLISNRVYGVEPPYEPTDDTAMQNQGGI